MFATPWLVQIKYTDDKNNQLTFHSDFGPVCFVTSSGGYQRCDDITLNSDGYVIEVHDQLGFILVCSRSGRYFGFEVHVSSNRESAWKWREVFLDLRMLRAVVGDTIWVVGVKYDRDRKRLKTSLAVPLPPPLVTYTFNYLFPPCQLACRQYL